MPPTNPHPPDTKATKPPPHLFRNIKQLSENTYLCLPRTRYSSNSAADVDDSFSSYTIPPDTVTSSLAPFTRLPYHSFHRQTVLLETSLADALVQNVRHVGVSQLSERHISLLSSLVVVKTCSRPDKLRREMGILESVHTTRQSASLFLTPAPTRAQFTPSASTSFLCFPPTFGPSLRSLGEVVSAKQSAQFYLPSWFIGHVFLHLLTALEILGADGVVHGAITADNVVVNVYPRWFGWRFRGYPDILLTGFSAARRLLDGAKEMDTTTNTHNDAGADVKAYLELMIEVVSKWSDCAPFIPKATVDGVMVSNDPVLLLMQAAREMLEGNQTPSLADVKSRLGAELERLRSEGPHGVPATLMKVLHSDLATEEEFRRGAVETTVLKFGARKEEITRMLAGEMVGMGAGGHVGMRTKRILVIRFTAKKEDYERVVGTARKNEEVEGMTLYGEGEEVDEMEM
ncbi:hypothetical protein BKA63DRAFT_189377 [Paraphoma chrysanthemicola]|nr:hypothetical protein BKA63DRAFT_189377 [Paraphoma chrysanthemicola]